MKNIFRTSEACSSTLGVFISIWNSPSTLCCPNKPCAICIIIDHVLLKIPKRPPYFILENFFSSSFNLSKFFFLVFFVIKLDKTFLHYHYRPLPLITTLCSVLVLAKLSLDLHKFGKSNNCSINFWFPINPISILSLKKKSLQKKTLKKILKKK